MIYNYENLGAIKTASDVKKALPESSHFFDRKTMSFFGDRMSSFGVKWAGYPRKRIMYRKPHALVKCFDGRYKTASSQGRCSVWEIIPKGDHIDLLPITQ